MVKLRLATPGPTEVPAEVQAAMAAPLPPHRSAPARALLARVWANLESLARTRRPVHVFSGSGTLGMEAAVVNHLSPGDEVVAIEAGKFGERWSEIARAYGLTVHPVRVEWGQAVRAGAVEEALAAHPGVKAVLATQVETSTATRHDVAGLARLVGETEALFVVDAVSSLGAVELETDEWGVDVLVSASQKALMLPPGLAMLCASEKAEARWNRAGLPRYFLDLRSMARARQSGGTAYTPALSLWAGLDRALEMILAEGVEARWRRSEALARAARAGLAAMKLAILSEAPAASVTAALLPPELDGRALVERLRERFNLHVGGGQGQLAGRIVRISHMGCADRFDLLAALSALESGLCELGHACEPGAGIAAAQRALEGGAS